MSSIEIPTRKIMCRQASVMVNCSQEKAFNYISSSTELPDWLKKLGPIPGAEKVEILKGPYDFVGAERKIYFDAGNVATEELISRDPWTSYSYKISQFNQLFGKLTDAAFGQIWFDQINDQTRIKWKYTFTYKNIFAKALLSVILTLYYKRYLEKALIRAKANLEKLEVCS